jgi:hypothetical protein
MPVFSATRAQYYNRWIMGEAGAGKVSCLMVPGLPPPPPAAARTH